MQPGQIERRTHDYERHGTTTLFAALDVKAGTIVGKCMPRHRASEFRKFLDEIERNVPAGLDMHVIMDNASSHKTKLIRRWFAKRPHWHVHFTPTSCCYLRTIGSNLPQFIEMRIGELSLARNIFGLLDVQRWKE